MFKIFSFALALSCYSAVAIAQDVKTISAYRQDWSGGIAGHYGTNYTFAIEFSHYKTEPVPDTIWIDNKPIPLTVSNTKVRSEGNIRRIPAKGKIKFEFTVGTSHDEYAERYNPDPSGRPKEIIYHQPVTCKGVALLSYHCNGRERYYDITKFTKVFPPVNYP